MKKIIMLLVVCCMAISVSAFAEPKSEKVAVESYGEVDLKEQQDGGTGEKPCNVCAAINNSRKEAEAWSEAADALRPVSSEEGVVK